MKYKTEKRFILAGERQMKLVVLLPNTGGADELRPGVLWIHGGGYVAGMAEMVHFSRARALAEKLGAVVVSPEYRLSREAPYPAALLDCHEALAYLLANAKALCVRSDQLIVGGESAGGGLAAALCMYEKDVGGISIAFQTPLYPMLDNEDTVTSRNNHSLVWNTRRNHYGWACYLRGLKGQDVPAYASPSRRKEHAGLPPAYTFISTAEPFYAETVAFIEKLRQADVPAAIDIYPGLFHSFDMLLPFLKSSRQAAAAFEKYFACALEHYFAEQRSPADRTEKAE